MLVDDLCGNFRGIWVIRTAKVSLAKFCHPIVLFGESLAGCTCGRTEIGMIGTGSLGGFVLAWCSRIRRRANFGHRFYGAQVRDSQ